MQPRCRHCRYTLTGLPAGLCPECGTDFHPNDPTTLLGPSSDALTLARFAPPKFLVGLFSALPIGYFLATNSPSGSSADGCAVGLFFVVMIPTLIWLMSLAAHLLGRAFLLYQHISQPPWLWRWLAFPLAIVLCITLQRTQALWRLRWLIARPHIEAFAKDPTSQPTSVAGFMITRINRSSDGTIHLTLGFPDSIYSDAPPVLIYAPDPYPWTVLNQNVDLGDSWFAWVDHS